MKTLQVKSSILIKIAVILLLLLSFVLIPSKAFATAEPSFSAGASPNQCFEGDSVIITITIKNTTGVDMIPTEYIIDNTAYNTHLMYMSPGQSKTINHSQKVSFNGNDSVTYKVYIVYHEDGGFQTYSSYRKVTISKSQMQVITPQPDNGPMGIITPVPQIDVPTPDLGNMVPVSPTPDNGLGNISVITPAPTQSSSMNIITPAPTIAPSATPAPTAPIHNHVIAPTDMQESSEVNLALAADTTPPPSDTSEKVQKGLDAKDISSAEKEIKKAGINWNNPLAYVKSIWENIDGFSLFCLGVIGFLIVGYVALAVKVNRLKKDK